MAYEDEKLVLRVIQGTQGEKKYLIGRYSASKTSKRDVIFTHQSIPKELNEKSREKPTDAKPETKKEIRNQNLKAAEQQLKLYVAEEPPSACCVFLVVAFFFLAWIIFWAGFVYYIFEEERTPVVRYLALFSSVGMVLVVIKLFDLQISRARQIRQQYAQNAFMPVVARKTDESIDIEKGIDLAVEEVYGWTKLSKEEQDIYLDVIIRVRAFCEVQFPILGALLVSLAIIILVIYTAMKFH